MKTWCFCSDLMRKNILPSIDDYSLDVIVVISTSFDMQDFLLLPKCLYMHFCSFLTTTNCLFYLTIAIGFKNDFLATKIQGRESANLQPKEMDFFQLAINKLANKQPDFWNQKSFTNILDVSNILRLLAKVSSLPPIL